MLRRAVTRRCAAAAAAGAATPAGDKSVHDFTPRQVVDILDNFVVGQRAAKRAVSVALRNRWRRAHLEDKVLQADVMPKNILMIGPTGVGKTEIARRMARVTDAPFVKVEATKYTEVGFKGKDVETIIEDLYSAAKNKARQRLEKQRDAEAEAMAHEVILNSLRKLPSFATLTAEEMATKLQTDEFDTVTVNVARTVQAQQPPELGGGGRTMGMDVLGSLFGGGERRELVTKPVKEALEVAKAEAFKKLVSNEMTTELAKRLAQEEGIVFIDEIDKVVSKGDENADVSSTGVQQDLLPLVEGSNVTTKDGTTISTDTILFVCSGAFHVVKPSDMIAELQGRLPVRVELQALTEAEFKRILLEPKYNLLRQQRALLAVEDIDIDFTDDGIDAIAEVATRVNTNAQNIGARRLHTVIERVMDEPSFQCDDHKGEKLAVNRARVEAATKDMVKNLELSRYLL